MTCVSPVRFEAACAQETQALDFGALKRMPESEVIRLGTLRYTAPAAAPAYAKDHDRTLAKLAELDPALRRLVLTEFVAQFARPDLKWEPDDREHLVYFFDLWWGDLRPKFATLCARLDLRSKPTSCRKQSVCLGKTIRKAGAGDATPTSSNGTGGARQEIRIAARLRSSHRGLCSA